MATASKSGDKPMKPAAKPKAEKAAKPATKAPAAKKAPAEKKPAVKKAPAAKKPAAKTTSVKPAAAPAVAVNAIPILTPDQRRYYVEVAAYYIAERRGFHGSSQMDDWVQAEEEIDRLVREGVLKP
ncbi:MAG: DUF2934 domain-containing protein [Pseudomonadota bacterium]